jgi:predicted Zn-dependent protease
MGAMGRTIAGALLLSACVWLAACEHAATPPKQGRPGSTANETALDTARRLALVPVRAETAVDHKLVRAVAIAKASPRRLTSYIELGRAWVQKARESSDPGYYANANAAVDLALDIAPEDPLALDLRTLVLLNDHRFREAETLARAAVQRRPDSAMAWGSLSDALLELGELETAERAAQTMLDLKPNLPSYSRASYFRWLHGDFAGAKELARLALDAAIDPREPEPRAWMLVQAALLFWHEGDTSGADAGFEKALAVLPDFPPAMVGRARVALANGRAAEASALLERAHSKSPLAETAWLLAQARELAGNAVAAEEAYAMAERDGRRGDRRALASMLAERNRDTALALQLARQERERRGDVYTDDALAWALYRTGNAQEAKAVIQRARRFGTRDARLMFHHGAILLANGDIEAGRVLLEQALAQNPHFDPSGAKEANELLRRSATAGRG